MNCVCKTCKADFKVEYTIDTIIDYDECQNCILEKEKEKNKRL